MGIIELAVDLVISLVGVGVQFFVLLIKVIVALIGAFIAKGKNRSGLFWGVMTYLFPFIIFLFPFIPIRWPKLPLSLRKNEAFKGKNQVIASIMALSGMIAKLDGTVTKEEIAAIRAFVVGNWRITKEELNTYSEAFTYGKEHPEAYQQFTTIIRESRLGIHFIEALAYLFIQLGMNEGTLEGETEAYIRQVLGGLGINNYHYNILKARLMNNGQDHHAYQGYQGGAYEPVSQADLLKKYSEILGVSEEASMGEIKKVYRKLVKEYHPDKLASESMPPDYVEFANKKIIEINEAYEYLKKLKG